jgi:hypothetical protein
MKPMKPKEEFASSLVKIPKFVKKEVASRSGRGFDFQTDYSLMAVTEEGNHEILAVVHPRYNLVQFSQIYKLATEKYENFSFLIDYFKGRGTLHIIPDNTDNTENEDKIGIVVDNSVDCIIRDFTYHISWSIRTSYVDTWTLTNVFNFR